MSKIKIFAILGLFAFLFAILAQEDSSKKQQHESVLGNRKPKTESEKKVRKIENIIYDYVYKGGDIKNQQGKLAVIADVKKLYPVSSSENPLNVDLSQIRKDTAPKVENKFPLTNKELTEKYEKEADEIFKPIPMNSVVTITYKQGLYTKTITGRYFGLTYYNDGVKIENSVVPIFDLSDIDKIKFDEKLRVMKKNEYVSSKVADYADQKKVFAENEIKEKVDSIVKQNEKEGFIFIWDKWLTPENVANVLITHIIDSSNQKALEPIFDAEKKKTEDSSNGGVDSGTKSDGDK